MKKAFWLPPLAALLCIFTLAGVSRASNYDSANGWLYIDDAYHPDGKIDLSISNITTRNADLKFSLTGSGSAYDGVGWTSFAKDSDGIDLKGLNNGFYLDLQLDWNGLTLNLNPTQAKVDLLEGEDGLYVEILWDTNQDGVFNKITDKDTTLVMAESAVPIPASALLFASSLIGLLGFKRKVSF